MDEFIDNKIKDGMNLQIKHNYNRIDIVDKNKNGHWNEIYNNIMFIKNNNNSVSKIAYQYVLKKVKEKVSQLLKESKRNNKSIKSLTSYVNRQYNFLIKV